MTALKERYHGNSLELAGGEDNEELTIQSKVVEVVGLKKIVERQRCVCVCVHMCINEYRLRERGVVYVVLGAQQLEVVCSLYSVT